MSDNETRRDPESDSENVLDLTADQSEDTQPTARPEEFAPAPCADDHPCEEESDYPGETYAPLTPDMAEEVAFLFSDEPTPTDADREELPIASATAPITEETVEEAIEDAIEEVEADIEEEEEILAEQRPQEMERTFEYLENLLDTRHYADFRRELEELNPVDAAEFFDELPDQRIPAVFKLLDKDTAADVFAELDIDTICAMVDDLIEAHGDYLPKYN